MTEEQNGLVMYVSAYCPHSRLVERFMKENEIPVSLHNIDQDTAAREQVTAINNGYASVPTIVFPDGSHLTEPSLGQLRDRLGMDTPGVWDRMKLYLGMGGDKS